MDDGSTDGSGDLCDELARKDPRVRVIHQENRGLSDARNTGIMASTGAFLFFPDSDDVISPVTLAHLWTACIRTGADAAIGDFIRFSEEKVPTERRRFTTEAVDTEQAICLHVVVYMRFLSDLLETDYGMFPDVQKRIISTLKGYRKEFMRSRQVRKVDKLKLAALLAGKRAFYLLYRISDATK